MLERGRLASIDMLRGVAILAVLIVHMPHDAPGGWREHPFFLLDFLSKFGYLGVPLFIMISGFCIHRKAAENRQLSGNYAFSWPQFWLRRFIRLYPPYLVAIALSLVASFFLHSREADPTKLLGLDLLTHLLLLHNLTVYGFGVGNPAFWSLGAEEQLYALYFVALLLMAKFSSKSAVWVAAVVTLVWRALLPHLSNSMFFLGPLAVGGWWFQWPMNFWLHWVLGAFAVEAWVSQRPLPVWSRSLFLAVLLIGVGMLCNSTTLKQLQDSSIGLPYSLSADSIVLLSLHNLGEVVVLLGLFCLLNFVLQREQAGKRPLPGSDWLGRLGRISYSVYLVHLPVMYVLKEQLPFTSTPTDWLPNAMTNLVVSVLAGWLFHHAVERWFLHGRWPRWRRQENAAQAAPS